MKKTLLTLLFFTLFFNIYSQERPPELQKRLDSLWQVWEDSSVADTLRLQAIKSYAWDGYLFSQPDSAYYFAQQQYEFAERNDLEQHMAKALSVQGISLAMRGNNLEAIEYFNQSLAIYEKNDNQKGVASELMKLGNVYRGLKDDTNALKYYKRSLAISEKIDNQSGIAGCLNNIGNIYHNQGDFTKALEYYSRSLDMKKQIGDEIDMAESLTNLGIVYLQQNNYPLALNSYQQALALIEGKSDLRLTRTVLTGIGGIYRDRGDDDLALDYYNRALKISEAMGNQSGIGDALIKIGNIYLYKDDNTKARDYYERALAIKEKMGSQLDTGEALNNIGITYKEECNYNIAQEYFKRTLIIAEKVNDQVLIAVTQTNIGATYNLQGYNQKAVKYCKKGLEKSQNLGMLKEQRNSCLCLYKAYKEMESSNKALKYHELLYSLNDSIYNEDNTKKITQLEMQYDFDKKEAATQAEQGKKDAVAAQELKQQKTLRNGFIGGFAVVLCFAGVFFIQRNRIGKEKKRSEELLLNILPAEVAEELKQKGEAEAKNYDMVSILFTDFKSFTEQSEKLTAAALVKEINLCFKTFDAICEKYNIEKIKTIGDAYMAAGGLPVPEDPSVKNTVLAALEMQAFIVKQHQEKESKGEHAFQMRVGIHTGPVVAGIVGVKKFQYDIWGDTVNTASRIESNGDVGKVNISEATYNYLKDDKDFVFESRGKVQAKGKGEIEMYFVSLRS